MKNTVVIFFIIRLLVTAHAAGAAGFKLVDDNDAELILHMGYEISGEYEIDDEQYTLSLSTISFSLKSELYKSLSLKLSMEFVESPSGEPDVYLLQLEDLYAGYGFHDFLSMRIGRFKVPFGEEVFDGADERPYIDHPDTTEKIACGRDLGIMASGENIFNLFGYDACLSSGRLETVSEDAESALLLTGKIFMRHSIHDIIDIRAGYYGYYHYVNDIVSRQGLAQGMFASLAWEPAALHTISLHIEYMERLRMRNVSNRTMDWRRGLFGILSYRYDFIEPVVVMDWYDRSLLDTDSDEGLVTTSIGAAAYFLEDDILIFKLLYVCSCPLSGAPSENIVSAVVHLVY
ncbi:MAG: hypothetical protein JW881_15625 [Spirochaetales bacterium]|nr:hypothetical protein [Spirochaetales bacterium]